MSHPSCKMGVTKKERQMNAVAREAKTLRAEALEAKTAGRITDREYRDLLIDLDPSGVGPGAITAAKALLAR